jgi:hypothetical protein
MDASALDTMVIGQLEKAAIIGEPASAAKGPHAIVEPKEKP